MVTKSTPSVVSASSPLSQYKWGGNCEAFNLVDNESLSIKLERMPAGTEETLHFHHHSQQFFFILQGNAVFEVDDLIIIVHEGEGLHIEAGRRHRIMNKENELLQLLVCSQPAVNNDRQNLV